MQSSKISLEWNNLWIIYSQMPSRAEPLRCIAETVGAEGNEVSILML